MTDCNCSKCVACCKRRPGWFKPGEAEKAAAFLNLSLETFFKEYLVADFWSRFPDNINLLMPRTKSQYGGSMLAYWDIIPAQCVFLTDDNLCQIHEVKPFECKQTMGCEEQNPDYLVPHEQVSIAWDNPEAQKQVEDLLAE